MSKQHVGRPRTISNDFLITYGILNILGLGGNYIRASSKLFLSIHTVNLKKKGIRKLGRSHSKYGQVFRTSPLSGKKIEC